ncbi:hypothetical protein L2E82_28117 [Cichorium intybus]|uniref:Uncharacterized protein n=1 Tax=Cichorium intybus TaxID=13427 RepID=A0ACB9CUW2_CICIN|nr:hypothetical protein L2E82_28117 [Cichorium intybus]
MSSSTYKQFAHLQIPLRQIEIATRNFSDANLYKESAFEKAYIGQLLWSEQLIDFIAQRYEHGDINFWKEISMLSISTETRGSFGIKGLCDGRRHNIQDLEGKKFEALTDPTR